MSSSERVDRSFLDPLVLSRTLVLTSALSEEVIVLAGDSNASLKSTLFPHIISLHNFFYLVTQDIV